ncbi:MAG: hypothetical protein WA667_24275 [Candidatus Nitrosopolaris sp.]
MRFPTGERKLRLGFFAMHNVFAQTTIGQNAGTAGDGTKGGIAGNGETEHQERIIMVTAARMRTAITEEAGLVAVLAVVVVVISIE